MASKIKKQTLKKLLCVLALTWEVQTMTVKRLKKDFKRSKWKTRSIIKG